MSASLRGIKKFQHWMEVVKESGWAETEWKWLADFWWEHHDDDGNLYPSGVKRSPAAPNEEKR